MLDLNARNTWTISVATSPPQPVVVKDGFRNVPRKALIGWFPMTPGNTGIETYYWDEPSMAAGVGRELQRSLVEPASLPLAGAGEGTANGAAGTGSPLAGVIRWLLWLAAAACGLQNAMIGTYSGAVVRTTHVSGIVTDLGTYLGQWLRGVHVDARRVRLYGALFSGFLGGGIASSLVFPYWGERSLLLPATLTGGIGIVYIIWRHRHPVTGNE